MTTGTGAGFVPGRQLLNIHQGIPVFRAASLLPQTAAFAIFNIVGGRVLMTGIAGRITVILGAVGNMGLEENPTAGTTELICAVVAAGTYAAGDMLGITGIAANAMQPAATGGIPAMTTRGVVLRVGTLDWRLSGSSTGQMEWGMTYIPIDDGAYVTVA